MTFESTPADYSSVNGDLVYVCYDAHAADPVTYPNYKYVAEIFINAVKVFTAKVFPQPDNNRGIFNFGSIVREYIEVALAPGSTGILAQEFGLNDWKIGIVVKIREEYGGTLGAVVLTDSERFYYNHYNGRINEFTKLDEFANKILSNRPLTVYIRRSAAKYYVPVYRTTTTVFNVDVTGVVSDFAQIVTPSTTHTVQLLNIAPAAINDGNPGSVTSAINSYTITIDNDQVITVNLVCDGMYENYMVHFLNQYGSFESMLFNKVRRITNEIERKSWQQLGYRVNGSGVVSLKTGDIMHAQKSNFGNRFTEKLRISTDLLTDAEYQWLAELVRSPYVLLEDDGTLYPILITDSNYEFKEKIVDRLTNLSLNVEFGTTYKTQYR